METTNQFVTKEKLETVTAVLQKVLKRLEDGEAMNRERDSKISFLLESPKSKSSSEDFIPQPPKKPINPNAEKYTLELGHGPYTIHRNDGESDRDWAGRKKHLMNQRVSFLNSSGASGTPEQEAYLKEIYDRLAAHGR
jgi:hypothetical protein